MGTTENRHLPENFNKILKFLVENDVYGRSLKNFEEYLKNTRSSSFDFLHFFIKCDDHKDLGKLNIYEDQIANFFKCNNYDYTSYLRIKLQHAKEGNSNLTYDEVLKKISQQYIFRTSSSAEILIPVRILFNSSIISFDTLSKETAIKIHSAQYYTTWPIVSFSTLFSHL